MYGGQYVYYIYCSLFYLSAYLNEYSGLFNDDLEPDWVY